MTIINICLFDRYRPGNVLVFTGSNRLPMKSVLRTPKVHVARASALLIEIYPSYVANLSFEVYVTSSLGQVSSLLYSTGNLTSQKWQNVSVCLEPGDYQLLFAGYTDSDGFVAINNVQFTNESCNYGRKSYKGSMKMKSISGQICNFAYSHGLIGFCLSVCILQSFAQVVS